MKYEVNKRQGRVVSWFSCGAASAVATILAANKYNEIEAIYCRVVEEHDDNLRFLDDFVRVTGIPVKTIMNEQYGGSIYNVFTSRKFIKSQYGAPCTTLLKKEMRKAYQRPDDVQVFGYTIEEQDRANRFIDGNNDVNEDFILIDNKVGKQDCYARLTQMGLKLPAMYGLGYSNNNCIGCVKGGMGYWNKIRKDFPEVFDKMAKMERFIGHAVNKDANGAVYLDKLHPTRGKLVQDMPADCGFTCEVKDAIQGATK
jgi:3'-phosphoadenosine 5'-phosphosulfate sulfotransferase (PAPS reductase)/FAD synthetase